MHVLYKLIYMERVDTGPQSGGRGVLREQGEKKNGNKRHVMWKRQRTSGN